MRIPTRIQVDGLMLRIRQILGIGAFVVVYKAVDEEEPWQIYALKEVLCLNASQFHNAVREVRERNFPHRSRPLARCPRFAYVDFD